MKAPPLTDEDDFPWSPHKGRKFGEVPPQYMLWLLEQKWIKDWPRIYTYLLANRIRFEKEMGGIDSPPPASGGEPQTYEDYLNDWQGF